MSDTARLDRLAAAGVTVRPDPHHGDRLRLAPPERLTPDLLELVKRHKSELLASLRGHRRQSTPAASTARVTPPRNWTPPSGCPLVRAHPTVALWAVCTGYTAKPGTPPSPTVPPGVNAST